MKNKICLVAPYRALAELAAESKHEHHLPIDVVMGDLEEGVSHALTAEKDGVQVIVSRGGTASLIRKHVKIPVVEIQVTGFDVLRVIYPMLGQQKVLGILGYQNVVTGCRTAAQILSIPIHEINLGMDPSKTDWEQIYSQIKRLIKEHGVNVIIGDGTAVRKLDFPGIDMRLIASGKESILPAVEEAARIVIVREEEQQASQRLQAILNFVHDGIVATDEKGLVALMNSAAERTFHIRQDQALRRPITSVIKDTRIDQVLKTGNPEVGQMQKVPGGHILTNRIPIVVNGDVKGVVATFQEVAHIQDAERTIRQTLYGKGLVATHTFDDILAADTQMKKLVEIAKGYSHTGATVLIQGESGTGKELFAQSIHTQSPRAHGPFVAVNCAALPHYLLESELFGYVEGAFTGAKKVGKIGLFELAHKGTIFLDEIGDMDKGLQSRLLRVLAERQVMRLGSDALIPVDIRVIAATNTDLRKLVQSEHFRKDLYYRLNVLSLTMIPLRERRSDIPLLVDHFFERFSREHNRTIKKLPPEVIRMFDNYAWPGNVRELKNVMERIVLSSEKTGIHLPTVRLIVDELHAAHADDAASGHDGESSSDSFEKRNIHLPTVRLIVEELLAARTADPASGLGNDFFAGSYQDIRRRIIRQVLKEEDWNKSRVARRLGVHRTTVDRFSEGT
jgi:transcriptional regulator with PAS, ATPase and Fis domain